MVYRVTLDDGTTMDVRVYRDCNTEEARRRVRHFFPSKGIKTIRTVAGGAAAIGLIETESE